MGPEADNFRPLGMPNTLDRLVDDTIASVVMRAVSSNMHPSQTVMSMFKEPARAVTAIQSFLDIEVKVRLHGSFGTRVLYCLNGGLLTKSKGDCYLVVFDRALIWEDLSLSSCFVLRWTLFFTISTVFLMCCLFLSGCCMAQRRSLSGRSPFCQLKRFK